MIPDEEAIPPGGFGVCRQISQHARPSEWRCVTNKRPTEELLLSMNLAWRLVKHVKSNAIVFCGQFASLGIGAG
ncbi:MAG: bifunctional phosphoribosylaminoimidazolecarboxamide formyltransferase/IMP cyclohydrolase, partial [Anaerolineae bacterium]|nr:bifunctional phosphoribosylaminoimidazolecarboxamide formyltransferase/IMP cyclohydrolase [Anaerolineae bacterium]